MAFPCKMTVTYDALHLLQFLIINMKFDCIVNNISFWIKNNKVCLLSVQRKFVSNKPCCNTLLILKRLSLTDVSDFG